MPFKSEKQKKFLFANKPKIAKRWADKYNKEVAKNYQRVKTENSTEKVSRMLDLLNEWNPKNQDLKWLKLDACAMLSTMLNDVEYDVPELTTMRPIEWHARQISDANDVLQNQIKRYEF